MRAWLVGEMTKRAPVEMGNELSGRPVKMEMDVIWANGMIGAMPVFKYKKDAKAYIKLLKQPKLEITEVGIGLKEYVGEVKKNE